MRSAEVNALSEASRPWVCASQGEKITARIDRKDDFDRPVGFD
jgi:hypothetical protein